MHLFNIATSMSGRRKITTISFRHNQTDGAYVRYTHTHAQTLFCANKWLVLLHFNLYNMYKSTFIYPSIQLNGMIATNSIDSSWARFPLSALSFPSVCLYFSFSFSLYLALSST